jgi:hypothetical protein
MLHGPAEGINVFMQGVLQIANFLPNLNKESTIKHPPVYQMPSSQGCELMTTEIANVFHELEINLFFPCLQCIKFFLQHHILICLYEYSLIKK